ncbi:tRNA (adenosine(37)-N6)-dimethylallyltransferase MiaA [Arcobacter sp. FWKO B]|uniref:tRNA (adenosine(37)-N6)-dimethylallyltransferase MiaA n=1 Tax=Arcobacter sp. FWKO B TaxID=2593672 RepID=UPI0018A4C803|nr:tRNA (adenosine(37)-N6)-dimethylallyltransferase MiaA [Arcobacter sp. FWKO B]QOG12571.1 tRNA (adenosine(37)-N6)-dimethylallyltransferase MiaA [Arcobacter sp. FWKO B]
MKQIAIIGTTASGKSALSIEVALKTDSIILSLDSLSVYKEIDIASAKPTKDEMQGILHFGIDVVYPSYQFGIMDFIDCYNEAYHYALTHNKNLIITGGSSFYLKSLIDGLSINEYPTTNQKIDISHQEAYDMLVEIDPTYMLKIDKNDTYRIEKAYNIYKSSNMSPSLFFENYKKIPIIKDIDIFEIEWDIELLRQRINLRTIKMIEDGLIDEVIYLEKKYPRNLNSMKSIGIIETLDYLDGKSTKKELLDLISIHTAQLAKKQRTFNKTQLPTHTKDSLSNIKKAIFKNFLV